MPVRSAGVRSLFVTACVLGSVWWPGPAAAQREPAFRNPRAEARALTSRAALDSVEQDSRALRQMRMNVALGTPTWLEFSPEQVAAERAPASADVALARFLARYRRVFGLDAAAVSLRETRRGTHAGMVHVRLQQYWNDVPVSGGVLQVHLRQIGQGYAVETGNGTVYADIDAAAAVPALDAAGAIAIARVAEPDWPDLRVDSTAGPALWLMPQGDSYRLAYAVRASAGRGWMDANTGALLVTPSLRGAGPGSVGGPPTPDSELRAAPSKSVHVVGYEGGSGTDALNVNRTFRVYNTGSIYELRSDELGSIASEVAVHELFGGSILGNCATTPVAQYTSNTWPADDDRKQQVSGMVNSVGAGAYYNIKFGRKSYDNGSPGADITTCVNGVTPGTEVWSAAAETSEFSLRFVRDKLPSWRGSAAAQDVVTHEFSHLVSAYEGAVQTNDLLSWAVDEGLADYVGSRHRGSACFAQDSYFSCFRDLTSTTTLQQALTAATGADSAYVVGNVLASALWTTAALGTLIGKDVDHSVYDAVRFYLVPTESMEHTRAAIVRAFQDRMHANQSYTVAVPSLEDRFWDRGIGDPPLFLNNSLPSECGWELDLDVGGSAVTRTYSVTFWDGNNVNQDQSPYNAGFVLTAGAMANRTGNQTFFVSSPAGAWRHTPDDGHYHAIRVRIDEGTVVQDYWKNWGPDYFCEQQPCWGQCLSVVGTAAWRDLPPSKLTVRQAVGSSVGPGVQLRGQAPATGMGNAGLAAEVARSGVMSIEYGVPVGARGETTIRIYDLRGRLIRTMRPGTGAGWASLTWDGLNDAGGAASGGVYLAVVSSGDQLARTKLIVPAR